MFHVKTQEELDQLHQETTIKDAGPCWSGIKTQNDREYPLGVRVHVPEGSYFGGTMICLADTYENGGNDCLFIQELVRLYQAGRLKVQ